MCGWNSQTTGKKRLRSDSVGRVNGTSRVLVGDSGLGKGFAQGLVLYFWKVAFSCCDPEWSETVVVKKNKNDVDRWTKDEGWASTSHVRSDIQQQLHLEVTRFTWLLARCWCWAFSMKLTYGLISAIRCPKPASHSEHVVRKAANTLGREAYFLGFMWSFHLN